MNSEIRLRDNMGFVLISAGFLLLISSLYFEETLAKPVMMVSGLGLIIAAVIQEYVIQKRHQTIIEVFSLILILLWGILHLMIW